MKILSLSNYFPEHHGGIEFVALNLVTRWRKNNQVRWMACDVHDRPHQAMPDDVPLAAINFTEERLGFPYPIPLPVEIWRIFEQVRWAEVVHLHDCLYMANAIAALAARFYQKPLVVTQHIGLVPYSQNYKNHLQNLAYHTLGKSILQAAQQVVFISQKTKEWFEQRFPFSKPPLVIPNGVDSTLFYPADTTERETTRQSLDLRHNQNVLLFVGRFTHKKGIEKIQPLAEKYPDWLWICVGDGEIRPERWGLPNVRVVPALPQSDLRTYYIAADLFFLPSVGEGFPLAAQEALSCGLPAALDHATASAFPDAPVLRFDASHLHNIAFELERYFNNPLVSAHLKRASTEYAQRWNWDITALRYEEIFSSHVKT
ncbi:MAG: glycosyltransferase family 4 protein [Anaerolineales bacterium]|nr:glycosyltransferase family 4 protein [Anaerolineales bacterium]MCX7755006.1 glycosyltransferase family 4 protein [Anaerolineales bacterium]MDW8278791.1 glycosyltransferase family 4 protein [Anaerolineales bacterium]